MRLSDIQAEFLLHVCELVQFATKEGFTVTGGELFRTREQQELHVAAGKSKTLDSAHLDRRAIDLNFLKDGKIVGAGKDLQKIGDWWEAKHPKNRWGGNWKTFKDLPHFERQL